VTKSTGPRRTGAQYVAGLAFASLASLACGGGGGGPPSGPAEQTSQIVFQSTRVTGTPDIFLMDPDGGNVRPVVTSDAVDQTPVLSPDGTTIAFVSDRDGRNAIYLVNIDGTGLHRLTGDTFPEADPAWSPDRQKLAYTRSSQTMEGRGLFVAGADGSDVTLLRDAGAQPAWSPDGTRIAFSAASTANDPRTSLWLMDADGSNVLELPATAAASADDPAWSPDGTRIAYGGAISNQDIFVVNADGSDPVNLTNTADPAGEIQPAWSPDGAYIVFTGFRNGNQEIVRRNAGGSSETVLTNLGAKDLHPSWSRLP
jgi:TolB protein